MANRGKCPRCDCEGNVVGCALCFFRNFKCQGNCLCCADQKMSSTETKSSTSNSSDQRVSTQQQARASNSNVKRESNQKQKREPLRPLILRKNKKAVSDNRQAASSNVSQSKAGTSKVSESCSNKASSTVGESNENKVNLAENKSSKVIKPKVEEPKNVMVNAETQTPKHKVTYVIEPEFPESRKESEKEENEYDGVLLNNPFWAQYDKVPCAPHVPSQIENQRKTNIITKEKLDERINELIGDQCLNCHCTGRNPRNPCDICRRTNLQCLGSCMCCSPFRSGQRIMIFITRFLYRLADGRIYGGGSVNL